MHNFITLIIQLYAVIKQKKTISYCMYPTTRKLEHVCLSMSTHGTSIGGVNTVL